MRSLKRHLSPGLAALAVLGFAGTAAAATPPDLVPIVDSAASSTNDIATNKWYVDVATPYSLRLHFATTISNLGEGPFHIVSGAGGADTAGGNRSAIAVQKVTDAPDKPLTNVKLLTNDIFGGGSYSWGISGVARYTLSGPGGGLVNSALGAICRDDSNPLDNPPGPSLFGSPTCAPLDGNAAGFSSGISSRYQDVIGLASTNTAYFDVTAAPPGPTTFTGTVDPFNEITESNDGNNVVTAQLTIPGVNVPAPTLATTSTTPVATSLAGTVVGGNVLAKAATAPPSALKVATAVLSYTLVSPAANGTATINPATGAASYTAKAGFTGADSFTYYAQDSRGIRSKTTTVTVNVAALPTGPGTGTTPVTPGAGGGTILPPTGVVTRLTLTLKPAFSVVRRGTKVFLKVSGGLPVSQAGRTVKIQRKLGKKVSTLTTVKVGRNGRYSKLVRVTSRTVSVRATIAASATAKASTSAFRSLVLVKPGK